MTEQQTVEQLAAKVGIATAEVIDLARRAGIKFDSPHSVISESQNEKLLSELKGKRTSSKGKSPLSLGGAAKGMILRPKLGLGIKPVSRSGSGDISIIHKRTPGRPPDLEPGLTRHREAVTPKPAKTTAESQSPATSTRQTRQSEARAPESKLGSGPVPRLGLTSKVPPKSRQAPARSAGARVGMRDTSQTTEQNVRAPARVSRTPEKKPRRGKSAKRRNDLPSDDLQLNEFQRRRQEGRSENSNGPLRSTLLTQGFVRPVGSSGPGEIELGEQVQVSELAHQMGIKAGELIKELMKNKIMATLNQSIDFDTAEIVADHFGIKLKRKQDVNLKQLAVGEPDNNYTQLSRPPVITVMGHVDHGKTSLLDYIRRTRVVDTESGGITQHIGAYHLPNDKGGITFLDTPGHAAFTAMRARGAQITDIVVLVVASDDKVMPQTIEAIQHARSAGVPIVVALNKIDRPEADPERLINELSAHELVPEKWGGDTQFVQVSAHTGKGIDELLDAVMLQAELLELRAPREGQAKGAVVESWLDKNRGAVATILVQRGTLTPGAYVIAGTAFGRVRAMGDEQGDKITSAGPSMPVEVLGLSEVPEAGDELNQVANERAARDLISQRQVERKLKAQPDRVLVNPFSDDPQAKVLPLVIKADTQGSIGAIEHALRELENDQLELKIVFSGVGGITESDASIAHATGARLLGFNVRAEKKAQAYCEKEGVQLKYYSIIYELIEEVDNTLHGLLDPIIEEKILGVAEVRNVFTVSRFGKIAGCMVTEGSVLRHRPIRVLRDNVVIFEGELESLKRFKDDAREVRHGMECGIGVKNYKDVRADDKIEVFERVETRPKRQA